MKATHHLVQRIILLYTLFIGCNAFAAGYSVLHEFDGDNGMDIYNQLFRVDEQLFGTAVRGGEYGKGVLFSMDLDGKNFEALHHFNGTTDGRSPFNLGAIIDQTLYGVTRSDEISYSGVLFSYNILDKSFTVEHRFTGKDNEGRHLMYSPIVFDGELYGMTNRGGQNDFGSVYKFNPISKKLTTLHSFSAGNGTRPFGGLENFNGWLIGMASDITLRTVDQPPNTEHGVIFRIRPNGSLYEVVYRFLGKESGGHPYGNLKSDGNGRFVGTTLGEYHNLDDQGTIFSISNTFQDYKVLHVFGSVDGDGSKLNGSLTLSDDKKTLYGVTHSTATVVLGPDSDAFGSNIEAGVLFSITPQGNDFTILHTFSGGENGSVPQRTPVLFKQILYGTTAFGGEFVSDTRPDGMGLIFSYTLPEQPTEEPTENNGDENTDNPQQPVVTNPTQQNSGDGGGGGLTWCLLIALLNLMVRSPKNLTLLYKDTIPS